MITNSRTVRSMSGVVLFAMKANAAKKSRIPREQLGEAAQVHQTVRQYLREVEEQNPVEEPVHEQDQVSTTDPDSTYATKGGTPARLGYYDNYLVDNDSCVIVGVQATAARMSQETVAAQDMLTRFAEWQGRAPESVAADTTYGNGEFLTVVGGSEHHPVYANPRQHPQKEESILRPRALHLRTGTQSLYLSRRPGSQLWRASLSESRLQLHWNPQTLWCVCAKSAMHQRPFSISEHPPAGTRPATRPGVSQHTRVCQGTTTEEESRSFVCGTQEPDRTTSPAPAEVEICAGAVLPGSGGAEHQASGAIPQPTNHAGPAGHRVAWGSKRARERNTHPKNCSLSEFFNTHRRLHQLQA